MDASAFRHFYDYHFSENRKLWESCVSSLSDEQFTRSANYSHGSVRDQVVHLIRTDAVWFGDLRGRAIPEPPNLGESHDRDGIRAFREVVEGMMREYLVGLQDDKLHTKPLSGEDKDLLLWQVLLHVANHGTDHRAQILRILSDLGVKTSSQDYIFYVYDHPWRPFDAA